MIKTLDWTGKALRIIDQTRIPEKLVYLDLTTIEDVYEAIRKLQIRGAPAIGVTAAYGLYLGLVPHRFSGRDELLKKAESFVEYLSASRPTAVNLHWALKELLADIKRWQTDPEDLKKNVLRKVNELRLDDENRCRKIGRTGAELIRDGMTILTHCNTGALATAGIGTALGVISEAHRQGKKVNILVDETRPLLQGARLTMWELEQLGIPATLITDSSAAYAMQKGMVDLAITGADRIASNGDAANKIGTYSVAVNCRHHQIPFYVAAPISTFDFSLRNGNQIPIEERDESEILRIWNQLQIAPSSAKGWNPAFDVTPAELISGIVTEAGIAFPPFNKSFNDLNLNVKRLKNHKEFIL